MSESDMVKLGGKVGMLSGFGRGSVNEPVSAVTSMSLAVRSGQVFGSFSSKHLPVIATVHSGVLQTSAILGDQRRQSAKVNHARFQQSAGAPFIKIATDLFP